MATTSEAYLFQFVGPEGFLVSAKVGRNPNGEYDKLTLQFYNPSAPEVSQTGQEFEELLQWLVAINSRFSRMRELNAITAAKEASPSEGQS